MLVMVDGQLQSIFFEYIIIIFYIKQIFLVSLLDTSYINYFSNQLYSNQIINFFQHLDNYEQKYSFRLFNIIRFNPLHIHIHTFLLLTFYGINKFAFFHSSFFVAYKSWQMSNLQARIEIKKTKRRKNFRLFMSNSYWVYLVSNNHNSNIGQKKWIKVWIRKYAIQLTYNTIIIFITMLLNTN